MKLLFTVLIQLLFLIYADAQNATDRHISKQADDFTITTTDGVVRNLYNTLDSGKTVFIDLFYTTCYWCQYYSPVIEEIYQNTGAGSGDIEFWGISNNLFDTNNVIDQYKLNYNITNPCAGPWGGGTTAFSVIVNGQNFQGFPTYCVICPDRTLYFDPCYPPTETGFDPYFASCDTLTGISENETALKEGIISVYPNPAGNEITLRIDLQEVGQLTIGIYNILGVNISSSIYEVQKGINIFRIPSDKFPDGTYILKMVQNGNNISTPKVIVLR